MNNSYLANHMSSISHSNKMNFDPSCQNRTKMYSPKMQLRDLMKSSLPQSQKENFNLNQSSLLHQRLSVENSLGEHPSNKTFESSKHLPPSGKMPESAKMNKKTGRTNFASFLKNRSSKQNILEINTSFQPNISELLQIDSKPSSTKNSTHNHSRYNYSPYQKRPSLFKENTKINLDVLSRNFPQTVKNSHSIHYERFNSPNSTCVNSPKFTQAYHPVIYESSNPTTLHTQEDVAVKLISPAKLKAKEDRTRASGVFNNLAKPDAKRGNSYRKNRRQSHLSETQDEPVSKLSTKAPSQYSDIRRSIPSQKSQSILKHETLETIEDCDNSSINQKNTTYLFESKKKEKRALDHSRIKQLSTQASLTKKPSIGFEQTSPNFELSDNEKYESLRKIPISAIKKNSSTPKRYYQHKAFNNKAVNDQGNTTINKSKEDYSLFSNHIEATNQKKKLKTCSSNSKKKITLMTENTRHHTEGFEMNDRRMISMSSVDENYEYLFDRNCTYIDNDRSLEPVKLRETKTLSPVQRLDNKPPLSQKENMKQVLAKVMKKDSVKRTKLKDIKNLIQDDEVLKDLQGLQLNNSSLKEKIRQQKQNLNLNKTVEDAPKAAETGVMQKDLYAIYFKTRKLIEEYQHREKQWANEKETLLARIEELEKNN